MSESLSRVEQPSDYEAAGRVLDWIGVAGGLPLSERVRLLAVEYSTRTGQLSHDEAEELSRAVLGSVGVDAEPYIDEGKPMETDSEGLPL